MSNICGYAIVDAEGFQGPCDRPATGWCWYQNVEHEDGLEPACDWHENKGGLRIHEAEAEVKRLRIQLGCVKALATLWEEAANLIENALDADLPDSTRSYTVGRIRSNRSHAAALREMLSEG